MNSKLRLDTWVDCDVSAGLAEVERAEGRAEIANGQRRLPDARFARDATRRRFRLWQRRQGRRSFATNEARSALSTNVSDRQCASKLLILGGEYVAVSAAMSAARMTPLTAVSRKARSLSDKWSTAAMIASLSVRGTNRIARCRELVVDFTVCGVPRGI